MIRTKRLAQVQGLVSENTTGARGRRTSLRKRSPLSGNASTARPCAAKLVVGDNHASRLPRRKFGQGGESRP